MCRKVREALCPRSGSALRKGRVSGDFSDDICKFGSICTGTGFARAMTREVASPPMPGTRCVRCGVVGSVRRERIITGLHVPSRQTAVG